MIEPWNEWHRQLREKITREAAELAAGMSLEDLTLLCRASEFAKKGAPVEEIVASLAAGQPHVLKQWIGNYDIAIGLIKDDEAAEIRLGRLW